MMEMVHEKYSTLLTEFIGTALTTILPVLFQFIYNSNEKNRMRYFIGVPLFSKKKYGCHYNNIYNNTGTI
jgi:hypothetical protein